MNRFLRYLLIIYTFLLPVQTRLFLVDSGVEYQRISLYGTQILFALIFILFLILEAKRKSEIRSTKSKTISNIQDPILKPLFANHYSLTTLFVLFFAIQLIISSRLDLTVQTLLWIIQTALFIWIVRREKMERTIVWVFIVSMCFQSVFIWVQVFTQFIPAFKWLGLAEQLSSVGGVSVVETSFGRFLRGYGSFPHPNIAGGWLLVAIIATSKFKVQSSKFKALFFTTLGLLVSGLVLTFSRSAILGLIVFIISQCIYALSSRSFIRDPDTNNKQKQTVIASSDVASGRGDLTKVEHRQGKIASSQSLLAMTIFIFLIFLSVAIPFRDLLFSRVNTSNRLESKSIIERNIYSDQAKQIIKDNLWFGVGLGNYTVELQKRYPNRPTYEYQPPHNVVVLAFSELGITGLAFVVFAFWIWFRNRYKVSGIRVEMRNIRLRFTPALGLFPILFLDHYFWSLYAGWMLAGILALCFSSNLGMILSYESFQTSINHQGTKC